MSTDNKPYISALRESSFKGTVFRAHKTTTERYKRLRCTIYVYICQTSVKCTSCKVYMSSIGSGHIYFCMQQPSLNRDPLFF